MGYLSFAGQAQRVVRCDVASQRSRICGHRELDMIADPLAHVSVKGNLDREPAERALD